MNNHVPFVHLFKTSETSYLYDVNTDEILRIPEEVYENIKIDKNSNGTTPESADFISLLKEEGYLKNNRTEEVEHPSTELLPDLLNGQLKQMILQVTQNCNLRCEYCIYSGEYPQRAHSQKKMTWDVAKKSIDFMWKHTRNSKKVSFSFYGGEPLLEFQLIKKSIIYAEEIFRGKELNYFITTNGTLLTDEIENFFVSRKVSLTFSLDGPEKIHDKHRKYAFSSIGSFSKLMDAVEHIRENHPEYYKKYVSYNAVLDDNNSYYVVSDYFTHNPLLSGGMVTASLATPDYTKEEVIADSSYNEEMQYEFFKIMLSRLGKLDAKHLSKLIYSQYESIIQRRFQFTQQGGTLPTKGHHGGPCIPGVLRLFVNAEGNLYPCERVSETSSITSIGNIYEGFELDSAIRILNMERYSIEMCRDCWVRKYCTACIRACDGGDGFSLDILKKQCIINRFSVESSFKDYCVMKELGHNFYDEKKGIID